ncbi:MAG: glycosyltransferase [Chloroflexi bacterium]|nr:glycosyltransferase [Chloroflexota bacterium]
MIGLILLAVYALTLFGVMGWMGLIGLRFRGTLTEHPLPDEPPSVSTVVPARNEERNIGRCATGLTHQDYPYLQMVFVDDDSEDATGDILAAFAARDGRIKVINTGGKPDDWNGKQWACWSGAQAASGDWLCFMDADTYAEPHLLTRTVAFAEEHNIDMLTLQPWYETRGLWERIILPQALPPILMVFPPGRVNDPDDPLSMANGQFILIRRSVYDAVDGHRGVKAEMMDDFSLAERVHGQGYQIFVAEGFDVMRVRLYTNLREIWAGAIKAAVQLTGGWQATLALAIGNLLLNTLPALLLIVFAVVGYTPGVIIMALLVIWQVVFYGTIRLMAFRAPPWTAVVYPFAGILSSLIIADGIVRVARGGEIKWKGRDVLGRPTLPTRK